jgi:hypothetical protein
MTIFMGAWWGVPILSTCDTAPDKTVHDLFSPCLRVSVVKCFFNEPVSIHPGR